MERMTFADFLSRAKRNFHPLRYEGDIHYRSVLFHQYGESYRYYCRMHHLVHEYDMIAYDVRQYEQRLALWRSQG